MKRKKRIVKKKDFFYAEAQDPHAHLPGLLLIALGMLALPINLGLIPPSLEWVKAWPLMFVLIGIVILVKTAICRAKAKA